jgi:hypothetical protein
MTAKLITAIRVDKLFGLYTYRLPETGTFSNAVIKGVRALYDGYVTAEQFDQWVRPEAMVGKTRDD